VRNLIGLYEARELVGFDRFLHVQAWHRSENFVAQVIQGWG
jgi:hypothetical protein